MKEGEVVLITLPQSDGIFKPRPALLLRKLPKFGDFLVCGISSSIEQEIPDFDLVLDESHVDFKLSGLKKPSVIRLAFFSVIPERKIPGSIGKIQNDTLQLLKQRLADYILK